MKIKGPFEGGFARPNIAEWATHKLSQPARLVMSPSKPNSVQSRINYVVEAPNAGSFLTRTRMMNRSNLRAAQELVLNLTLVAVVFRLQLIGHSVICTVSNAPAEERRLLSRFWSRTW